MRAEDLAKQQREISISEFFEKNRHLLGYDNKVKALLMIVKEGVDNALDATEEAGILPDIYVKVKEIGNEKYEILIKDNGPGIAEEDRARLFQPFARLESAGGERGVGLGLSLVKTIVERHGGRVTVDSRVGEGSTFGVWLPSAELAREESQ